MLNRLKKKIDSLKFQIFESQILEEINYITGLVSISEKNPDDIYIAGYPKSGNTWMQNIVAGLIYGIQTSYLPDKLTQRIVPDVHMNKFYLRFATPTFFKTHEFPSKEMRKVIHLVRDGRDVMASYFAMNNALNLETNLEDMIIHGKSIFPSKWHVHTRAWIENPYNSEIITIKYEDLLNNPFNEVRRLLKFIQIERDNDLINKVLDGNSFSEMKRKEREFGWSNENWNKKESFIRVGEIGSYRKEIPLELIHFFEKEAKRELEYFNYL